MLICGAGIVLPKLLPTLIVCLLDDSQIQQTQMFTLVSAEPLQNWFIEQICNQCKKGETIL